MGAAACLGSTCRAPGAEEAAEHTHCLQWLNALIPSQVPCSHSCQHMGWGLGEIPGFQANQLQQDGKLLVIFIPSNPTAPTLGPGQRLPLLSMP